MVFRITFATCVSRRSPVTCAMKGGGCLSFGLKEDVAMWSRSDKGNKSNDSLGTVNHGGGGEGDRLLGHKKITTLGTGPIGVMILEEPWNGRSCGDEPPSGLIWWWLGSFFPKSREDTRKLWNVHFIRKVHWYVLKGLSHLERLDQWEKC